VYLNLDTEYICDHGVCRLLVCNLVQHKELCARKQTSLARSTRVGLKIRDACGGGNHQRITIDYSCRERRRYTYLHNEETSEL
jgi:hypothetical protein